MLRDWQRRRLIPGRPVSIDLSISGRGRSGTTPFYSTAVPPPRPGPPGRRRSRGSQHQTEPFAVNSRHTLASPLQTIARERRANLRASRKRRILEVENLPAVDRGPARRQKRFAGGGRDNLGASRKRGILEVENLPAVDGGPARRKNEHVPGLGHHAAFVLFRPRQPHALVRSQQRA